mgnify:CR=1 FL=1
MKKAKNMMENTGIKMSKMIKYETISEKMKNVKKEKI